MATTLSNQDIATTLEELARLMELTGEDSFRVGAHTRAARAVEGLSKDVSSLVADAAKAKANLTSIDGVGPKLAEKIIELTSTGSIADLDALRQKVPAGLLDILKVPGLGPKTVKAMWDTGITDIPALKAAIENGALLKLPRMGEKAVAKIKESLSFLSQSGDRVRLGQVAPIAQLIASRLTKLKGVVRVEPAGSLRRGRETIGDIDILVAIEEGPTYAAHAAEVTKAFCTSPGVVQVIAQGESKSSVRHSLSTSFGRWSGGDHPEGATAKPDPETTLPAAAPKGPSIQVDLRILPASSFGSALIYFTGSKEHNVRLRERALAMKYTLNEWGLFPNDSDPLPPQQRGIKPIASRTEEEVFAALGLPWIPPQVREDRNEIAQDKPWDLLQLADIKAELHAHTTASDGMLTIEELALEAKSRGFHTIAVTDHSQSSVIARGLKPDRLREHIKAVHEANKRIEGITIFAGSEVDILADGTLDYEDDLLADLDVVVASPHAALSQDPVTATKRLIKAIEHPLVHILGHPTGRLILRRPGLAPAMDEIYAAAKEHDVALEINAHWMRLDLRDVHVRGAIESGCLIAINCDDHERGDFDNLVYGVLTAQRGWVRAKDCINAWDKAKLHRWLAAKRSGK